MKQFLVFDGDTLLYKIRDISLYYKEIDGFCHKGFDKEEVINLIDSYIDNFFKTWMTNDYIICLSCLEGNFRYDICDLYKKKSFHDETMFKEQIIYFIRDYLMDNYNCHIIKNYEADDTMGVTGQNKIAEGYEVVYVHIDKDIDQFEGLHIKIDRHNVFDHDRNGFIEVENNDYMYFVSDFEAKKNLGIQWMSGDKVDGIKGCKGYSEIKSRKLLETNHISRWKEVILKNYIRCGHDYEDCMKNYKLVKLKRK